MNVSQATNVTTDKAAREASESYGKTREELDFWINCVGAPLVVVEKHALTLRSANRSAATFFGIDPATVARMPMHQLVGEAANQMLGQIWSTAPIGVTGEPFLIRSVIHGQERLLMVQVTKLVVEGEQVRLFTFMDAPPQGSVALAGWQENIIDMLNWLPFGFEIASTDDQIQFANSQFSALFGYRQDEVESIEDWWRLAYPDPTYREFAKNKWHSEIASARAENREMTPFDLDVTIAGGGSRTIQFRHRTIGNFNVNLYLDVTRERAYAQELKSLAATDPLTGAINRRRFFEEALPLYERTELLAVAVLMLDIDHFKAINDEHGHGVGDLVLKEFTSRCQQAVRSVDLFARFGGEEFAVLLYGQDVTSVYEVAQRPRTAINSRPFEIAGLKLAVSVSIGGSSRTETETLDLTLSRADKALYKAKQAGRDCVVLIG